jgi:SSS family solute:Na+ symporter
MGFSTLDYFIVVLYLVGIAVFGIIAAGKQKSLNDYFLGGKNIPWWAVCFAIVATETSTLTFISIPGLAYLTNLNFLQVTFGYLIGRIVVSFVILPVYYKGEVKTAYTYLSNRFAPKTRNIASITFMFTRIIADGVRLFATAIPLAILLKGWNGISIISNEQIYIISIVTMAAITIIYTYIGGVRAVIWTDVVQMFIYLIGAIISVIIILGDLPNGFYEVINIASEKGKLNLINFGLGDSFWNFFLTPYTFIASVLGGAFLSMASHGTDQLIVQRLLTVRTLRDGQRALIGSGIVVIFQFAVFLFIGILLYGFYGGQTLTELNVVKADEIFPKFIIERIPTGVSGLIIAGLLAAAMSTLSGSINSLASAFMIDIYKPYLNKNLSEKRELSVSRLVTMIYAVLLIGVAIFFIYSGSKSLVEIALSVASFTYGGLLGLFLLGILIKNIVQTDALISFFVGIFVMIFVAYNRIGWTWLTFIGCTVTFITGCILCYVRGKFFIKLT